MTDWIPEAGDCFYVLSKPVVKYVTIDGGFGMPTRAKEVFQDKSYADCVFEVVASDVNMVVAKKIAADYLSGDDKKRNHFFRTVLHAFSPVSPEVKAAVVRTRG